MAILGRRTHAQCLPGADGRDLVKQDRHTFAGGDNGSGKLVGIAHPPIGSDGEPFAVAVDDPSARAGVVALQRRGEILQGQPHCGHALHVGHDEIFLGVAAKGVDPRQSFRAFELRRDDPILDGAQIGCLIGLADKVIAFRRDVAAVSLQPGFAVAMTNLIQLAVLDGPHEDVAEPGRDRPHFGVHALGKVFLRSPQPLGHLLSGKVDIGLFIKYGRDLGEPVAAERTSIFKAGDAGERGLDRERDLLLDLIGGEGRSDDVDLHLVVGDVGNGVDRELAQRADAEQSRGDREKQDKPALLDGEGDDATDHGSVLVPAFALAEFGLEREAVGGGDPLRACEPGRDDDLTAVGPPQCHRRCPEPCGSPHEDERLVLDHLDRGRWHRNGAVPACGHQYRHIDRLADAPCAAGIVERDDHRHQARGLVQNGGDEGDAPFLTATRCCDLDARAGLHPARIARHQRSRNRDLGKVGDPEKLGVGGDRLSERRRARDDLTGDRRTYRDTVERTAPAAGRGQLLLCQAQRNIGFRRRGPRRDEILFRRDAFGEQPLLPTKVRLRKGRSRASGLDLRLE